jgi:hypothetical protein
MLLAGGTLSDLRYYVFRFAVGIGSSIIEMFALFMARW